MRTIYKYTLEVTDEQLVELPVGSHIIDCQNQKGAIVMWAMIETEQKEMVKRKIIIYGTGHPIKEPESLTWLDTVQVGNFVWHIFERIA